MSGKQNAKVGRIAACFIACAIGAAMVLMGCASDQVASQDVGKASSIGGRDVAAYVGDQPIYEDEVSDYTSSYRASNNLTDDNAWANYLTSANMTGKTWREDVIRQKADRMLVEQKADELGIVADEKLVDRRMAEMREQSGAQSDGEWAAYLEQSGQTAEELRDALEFSSVEQRVLNAELDLSEEVRSDMCDDYLATNMADQVVRHYYVYEFALGAKADARALLDELAGLDADGLAKRFAADVAEKEPVQAVDLGWDFLYDETRIDPKLKLRHAMVDSGALYGKVLKGADALRVVYCAEREDFGGKVSYDAIKSESLREVVADLTISSQWTALLSQYLSKLETEANVQVIPMPDGLSYDVVE